jgi:hypothetical protein
MEMNWVLGVVLIAAIVAVVVIIVERSKLAPKPTDSDYRAENEILKGKLEGMKVEIESWKERGTRALAARDKAYEQVDRMHEGFVKMVNDASQIENLKELLKKCPDTEKKSS